MSSGGQPFVYRMPVRFADVDHAGIVYYPVFYHYFHVTFEEFFRHHMGGRAYVDLLDVERVGFPAVATECQYTAPLKFGESVEVEMAAEKVGRRSVTIRYRAFRVRDDGDRALSATGRVTSAVVDLERFEATEPPAAIRALFEGIQAEIADSE